jgi:xylitol oxidase
MTREHNWADNHTYSAGRIHRPASIDEVRRLVARSPRIRAVGARHSFNGVADSPGELIDLRDIDPGFRIDPDQRTVTVGAATNYGVLAAHLHRMGWALHNMASLPHVSVAGAVATGTHGSGDRLGNLATAVAALEIVCATGDVTTIRRGDPGFDGMVVALGALGIVTRVTLDIEPAFRMRQDAFEGLTWATLLAELDAVMSAGYSVSLFTVVRPDSDPLVDQDAAGRRYPGRHAGGTLRGRSRRPPAAPGHRGGDAADQSVRCGRSLVGTAAAFPARCRAEPRKEFAERIHGASRSGVDGDRTAARNRRPD